MDKIKNIILDYENKLVRYWQIKDYNDIFKLFDYFNEYDKMTIERKVRLKKYVENHLELNVNILCLENFFESRDIKFINPYNMRYSNSDSRIHEICSDFHISTVTDTYIDLRDRIKYI